MVPMSMECVLDGHMVIPAFESTKEEVLSSYLIMFVKSSQVIHCLRFQEFHDL